MIRFFAIIVLVALVYVIAPPPKTATADRVTVTTAETAERTELARLARISQSMRRQAATQGLDMPEPRPEVLFGKGR